MNDKNTILGLDENIEGALAYVFGFLTGILLLLVEKENEFVKFHAIQSTGTFILFFAINIFINILYVIPYIGWVVSLLSILLMLGEFVLWIFLMYKAYNHEKFKLPIIGNIADANSV